jgi:SAM-dependent methyltransferase
MTDPSLAPEVRAGQAVYSKAVLAVYDQVVLGLFCRFVWRCPSRHILDLYRQHLTANHLDAGVGTGYFLDKCAFPSPQPRLALLDLNPNSLEVAGRRLARYRVETYRANVLDPLTIPGPRFDSVGVNFLLHCLPGPLPAKAVALDHLKAVLNPGGVLFGSTLLAGGVKRPPPARLLMRFFNAVGVFGNAGDDLDGLTAELTGRFADVSVHVIGCLALFSGRA